VYVNVKEDVLAVGVTATEEVPGDPTDGVIVPPLLPSAMVMV
jgi:hypothetical protein